MVGNSKDTDVKSDSLRGETSYWHRAIPALGVLILFGAVGKSITTFSSSGILLEALLDLVLIGAPGLAMLYLGLWLPNTIVRPAFYPRITVWVLGGVTVMGIVLGLRIAHPGVSVDYSFGAQAVLLATGSVAGFGAGFVEAQARIHASALETRNEELRRTEGKLEEAVSELEASNARLEQFAHAASHDLQEPLRMVTNYLELVESRCGDELDDDATEFIEIAVDGAERMQDMIDGLLEFSRVETQGKALDRVDLDAVLDDVLTDVQFRIEETDATVTRESLPAVEGDAGQLRQVFQNLLTNAIDYSGDEPPRIHVSAERVDSAERVGAAERDGSEWVISVRDEGRGIDADDTDRVFDVFQRLHTTDEQPGSGIGLALCDRVVERHGGEMRVESEPGEGSTFSFTLPHEPDLEAAAEAGAPLAESRS